MKRVRQTKQCLKCDATFFVKPSHFDKKFYCSMKCMAEDYSRRMSGKNNPNYRNAAEKTCKYCKAVFGSYAKSSKFCSFKCYVDSGENAENAIMNGKKSGGFGRKDKNQNDIVDSLRKLGCGVIDLSQLGHGFPDLLVSHRGELFLMEVKNPNTSYGKRGLNPNQKKFAAEWNGSEIHVIYSIQDAIKVLRWRHSDIKIT